MGGAPRVVRIQQPGGRAFVRQRKRLGGIGSIVVPRGKRNRRWRRSRRPHGGRSSRDERPSRRRLRRRALAGAKIPARRTGRSQSHAFRTPRTLSRPVRRCDGAVAAGDRVLLARRAARLGAELGEETFVGSCGRVFPRSFKATPLLRAWLRRLAGLDVTLRPRRRLVGFGADGRLRFAAPDGLEEVEAGAIVLALGGASWPRLGADGSWAGMLRAAGVEVAPAPRQLRFRGRMVARLSPALRRPAAEGDRRFARGEQACAAKR